MISHLTGRHVLGILIGFFLVVLCANLIFVTLAVQSYPGEHEKKSYLQGLNYNQQLNDIARQSALGWAVSLSRLDVSGQRLEMELSIESKTGNPVTNLNINGTLSRLVDDDFDQAIQFHEKAPGRYEAVLTYHGPGVWRLKALLEASSGETLQLDTRVDVS